MTNFNCDGQAWLVVIGGGIHGLCLVLRLVETVLGDGVVTGELGDADWKLRQANWNFKERRALVDEMLDSIIVVERTGKWCGRWRDAMDLVGVEFLRSPVGAHLDPSSRDSLMAFMVQHARYDDENDSREMETDGWTCSNPIDKGKNISKHLQHRLPSTSVFNDHIDHLLSDPFAAVNRTMVHDSVEKLERIGNSFQVSLASGKVLRAQNVVHAVGPLNNPCIPSWAMQQTKPNVRHVWELLDEGSGWLAEKRQICVIGAGLTAVNLCRKLAQEDPHKQIFLIAKKKLRAQQLDTEYGWHGLGGTAQLATFFQSSPLERLEIVQRGRHGGTINPEALRRIVEMANVTILENQHVVDVLENDVLLATGERISCDAVVLCTGSNLSVDKDKLLHPFVSELEAQEKLFQGLPELNDSLSWPFPDKPSNNLYVMGGLAQLVLGPMAINIEGARLGSTRIANHLYQSWTPASNASISIKNQHAQSTNRYSFLDYDSDSSSLSD